MSFLHRLTNRLALCLVIGLALAACGTDDGATVTEVGSAGSGSAASGSEASGSSSGSSSATADSPCQPVNEDLEGQGQTIEVVATDFDYNVDDLELPAGITTFEVDNQGAVNHELAFLPGGGEVPFTADGEPDEDALEAAGAFELEGFSPGLTCTATYNLEPGDYTLFCIISTDEGVTHYELGMRSNLVIT